MKKKQKIMLLSKKHLHSFFFEVIIVRSPLTVQFALQYTKNCEKIPVRRKKYMMVYFVSVKIIYAERFYELNISLISVQKKLR